MRVLSVVGNRPQFIKSAPLSAALRDAGIDEVVVHTGQHWDAEMSQVFFEELGIPEPAHRLDLRTADVDAMRPPIEELVAAERPDWVVVYGDTNSTAAGGRAGAAKAVPVAHVEAGLRSGDLAMPEERNRIEVDRIAALLFAPDERSADTLRDEGVHGEIAVVGDVMADATLRFAPVARARAPIDREPGSYAVATVHREANVLQPRLGRIVEGLNRAGLPVLFPAHPRTRAAIERDDLTLAPEVELLPPLGYLEMASLASQARVILTDSGGLQKEAYWYRVPAVTMRPSTEWVDTLAAGANVLVDDDPERIAEAARTARFPENAPPLYGDGRASVAIAHTLARLSRS
jgi:UDP-N-acetylglucosamine 2-epimerase